MSHVPEDPVGAALRAVRKLKRERHYFVGGIDLVRNIDRHDRHCFARFIDLV